MFHADAIARSEKDVGREPDGLLAAPRDEHIICLRGEPTRVAQHLGERSAQARLPPAIAVVEHLGAARAQHATVSARQELVWEEARVGHAARQQQHLGWQPLPQIAARCPR